MKIYRNIYFKNGIEPRGRGTEIIYYTGHLYSGIKQRPNDYLPGKDLYLECSICAKKKYKQILKKR